MLVLSCIKAVSSGAADPLIVLQMRAIRGLDNTAIPGVSR